MKATKLRMVGIFDDNNVPNFAFSEIDGQSHREILSQLSEKENLKRNYEVPIYGRFYSLIAGNSKYPVLIIYGESSDYRLEELGHYQDIYEKSLREFAYTSKYDILFLS